MNELSFEILLFCHGVIQFCHFNIEIDQTKKKDRILDLPIDRHLSHSLDLLYLMITFYCVAINLLIQLDSFYLLNAPR